MIGEILTGIGSLATGIGALGNLWQSNNNYQLQKQNYDYQKDLQQTIFNREDTSLARRMEDARNAGLNPYSVINQGGAGAGSVVKVDNPQSNINYGQIMDSINAVLDMQKSYYQTLQQKQDVENTAKSGLILDADLTARHWQNRILGLDYMYNHIGYSDRMLDSLRNQAQFNYDFGTDFHWNQNNEGRYNIFDGLFASNPHTDIFGKSGTNFYNRNWYKDKDIEYINAKNYFDSLTANDYYNNYFRKFNDKNLEYLGIRNNLAKKDQDWYNWEHGLDMASDVIDSVSGLLFKDLDIFGRGKSKNRYYRR